MLHRPKGRTDDPESMSLLDKMSMWNRKSGNEQKLDNCDLFESIEDLEEEDAEEEEGDADKSELSLYSKAIMNSTAYKWLIASLLKQSSLHWDDSQPRSIVQEIRQTILKMLSTGSISKKRAPSTYSVVFHLPWRPLKSRGEMHYSRCPIQPGQSLSECTVLSCSSADRVQAMTIRQYLDQTWYSGGTGLLFVLQEALEANHSTLILPDNTTLESFFDDSGICIWVTGPAYSIAECGEQLAWLVAALQPPNLDSVVHSIPSITAHELNKDKSTDQLYQHHWYLGYDHKSFSTTPVLTILQRMRFMSSSTIVRGFPTVRRPDDFPGVEVLPEALFDLVRPLNLKTTGGHMVLEGRRTTLELVKETTGVLLWHVVSSPPICSCRPHVLLEHNSNALHLINVIDLHNYRHILGDCHSTGASFENHGSPALRDSDEETFDPVGCVEISSVACASPADTLGSAPGSAVIPDSLPVSFDSDVLSMSDTSEDMNFQPLHPEDALFPIINTVVYRLLRKYRGTGIADACEILYPAAENEVPNDNRSPGGSNGTSQASRNSFRVPPAPNQRSKRPFEEENRSEDDDNETNGDGCSRRPPKRPRLDKAGRSPKLLACPFWKLNPGKHRGCFRMKLDKISRVKQHLTRKHTPDFYCEFCLLISLDEESHQRHVESRLCSYQSCEFSGITHRQQRLLSRKSKPNHSESDQWFAIWDIIFPNRPRPPSSYIDPDLSEELCQFREYAQIFGPAMLAEEIRARDPTAALETRQEIPEGEIGLNLESVISHGLTLLFEAWLSRCTSSARSIASIDSSSLRGRCNPLTTQSRGEQTPASSFPDSGVMMGSQVSSGHSRQEACAPELSGQEETEDQVIQTQWRPAMMENADSVFPNIDQNPTFTSHEYFPSAMGSHEDQSLDILLPFDDTFEAVFPNMDYDTLQNITIAEETPTIMGS